MSENRFSRGCRGSVQGRGVRRREGAPLIALHVSGEDRMLYEQLGFVSAPEMRLFTEHSLWSAWVPAFDAD